MADRTCSFPGNVAPAPPPGQAAPTKFTLSCQFEHHVILGLCVPTTPPSLSHSMPSLRVLPCPHSPLKSHPNPVPAPTPVPWRCPTIPQVPPLIYLQLTLSYFNPSPSSVPPPTRSLVLPLTDLVPKPHPMILLLRPRHDPNILPPSHTAHPQSCPHAPSPSPAHPHSVVSSLLQLGRAHSPDPKTQGHPGRPGSTHPECRPGPGPCRRSRSCHPSRWGRSRS